MSDTKEYLFIVKTDDDKFLAATKFDLDQSIQHAENSGSDLGWTTIARIVNPSCGLSPDFDPILIEFLDSKLEITLELRHKAAIAIIQKLI